MERITKWIFKVPSDSDFDKKYIVDLDPAGDCTCTCTAYSIKKNKNKKISNSEMVNRPGISGDPVHAAQFGWCKHIDRALGGFWKPMEIQTVIDEQNEEFEAIRAGFALQSILKELGG